ncbi:MAG: TonB-dependent receptor [Cytophagales bacterium]|nr:TonB-dependent receptor [Cytophagales bacterium]MDW8383847.1 TonB-dependent receptor [Flammeovirgaceae bacterium]
MQQIRNWFIIAASFLSYISLAQKYTIKGYIKDARNGEDLIGATFYVPSLKTGATTNEYGFFSLTLPKGTYQVEISYIGYQTLTQTIELYKDITQNFEINEDIASLQEVEIIGESLPEENVKSVEMSANKVGISTIKKMPALLGEVDVIRSITLLPGVTTAGEGAGGFNVRGGGIDQNLVLLDEAPVYNSSRLLGFFSVFNPDAVKDVKLYKGAIPAQYGGRVASVLDVRLKEGNMKRFEMNGGIGLLFSRLSLEAPFVKDRSSFLIAGRRSYADVLAKPFVGDNPVVTGLFFYDLTAKANYVIGMRDRIYVSGYFGEDVFNPGIKFVTGNATGTFRWNHVFSNRLFMNMTTFFSQYNYRFEVERGGTEGFKWRADITNYSGKAEFGWFLNAQNTVTFGAQAIHYTFNSGETQVLSAGEIRPGGLPKKYALENALYVANEQTVNQKISLQYGIRYSWYDYYGDGTIQTYNDTTPGLRRTLINQTQVPKNQSIKQYMNWEPRLGIKYQLNEQTSLKLGYNRTAQYIHLLSNTVAASPLDIYTSSNNNVKPQIADQLAVGYFRNLKNNLYEFSIETYYKYMQNQLDFINGANLFLNSQIDGEVLQGIGRAYGLELYLKKNAGKFTGWTSITLARTERKINGINRNEWYPTRFDKVFTQNLTMSYEISKQVSISGNFVFFTGVPGTYFTNRYIIQGVLIGHDPNESRNNARITPYHRLDLSVALDGKNNDKHRWKSQWVFSLYNVYGRRNPFSITTATDTRTVSEYTFIERNQIALAAQQATATRLSIFAFIIPGITYNFKF